MLEVRRMKRVTEARKVTSEPSAICKDGTDEGSQNVECRWPTLQTKHSNHKGGRPRWYRWSTNGRPCCCRSTARREREKSQVLGSPFQWSARRWRRTPRSTIFFGCQLLGYVSRAVRPSVSYNYTKRTIIPRSWKATKTFTIIGQNNERINQTNSKTN